MNKDICQSIKEKTILHQFQKKKKKEEQGALAIKILKMESGLTRIHTAVLGKPVLVWKFTFVWSELSVIL